MMRAAIKRARAARVMVMAMSVVGNYEGKGNKGNCAGNKGGVQQRGQWQQRQEQCNKGGRQATAIRAIEMATATMWGMAMATRQVGDKKGKGKGSKGNGNGNEGGGQRRVQGGKENGDGNKGGRQATAMVVKRAMAMVMSLAGKRQQQQRRWQWQRQCRWRAT
jgi:hypothetical protein